MLTTRRIGGYAALAEVVVSLLTLLVLYGIVLPRTGLTSPQAFSEPGVLQHRSALELIAAFDLPLGMGIVVVTLALRQVLKRSGSSLADGVTIAAAASATLFLGAAAIGWRALAELARAGATTAASAFPALVTMFIGIETLAIFSLGIWLLLVSAAAWNQLPRALNVIGVLAGVLFVITIVVPTQPLRPLCLSRPGLPGLAIRLLRPEELLRPAS